MATNIRFKISGGAYVDPDDVFEPRGSTTARTDLPTSEVVSGQTIADRYRASTGSDTPSGTSTWFFKVGSSFVDALSLFRRKGFIAITSISGPSSVNEGEAFTITSAATGAGLHYEWLFNGTPISGAPDQYYYHDSSASSGDAGTYSVRVYNAYDSVVSSGVSMSVTPAPAYDSPSAYIGGSSTVSSSNFSSGSWYFGGSCDIDLYVDQVRYYVVGHGGSWLTVGADTSWDSYSDWSDPYAYPSISHSPGSYTFVFELKDSAGQIAHAEMDVTVT